MRRLFSYYPVCHGACYFGLISFRAPQRCFFTHSFVVNANTSRPEDNPSVGLQVNLPPLGTWGTNPEVFAKQVLHYVDFLLSQKKGADYDLSENRTSLSVLSCVMLRLFPDASLVQHEEEHRTLPTKDDESSCASTTPLRALPPLYSYFSSQRRTRVWGGLEPEEAFQRAILCLSLLLDILSGRHIVTLLCLPTRLVVSQSFLDKLSQVLAHHSRHVQVAIELPPNQMLLQQERCREAEKSWLRLSSLAMPWEASTPLNLALSSRHTTLPLHVLFPWARDHRMAVVGAAAGQQGLNLVLDTVPSPQNQRSIVPDDKTAVEERRWVEEQRRQKSAMKRQNCKAEEELKNLRNVSGAAPHRASPASSSSLSLGNDSSFTLDIPSEEMRAVIMQSIKASSNEDSNSAADGGVGHSIPLDSKDLNLFLQMGKEKAQKMPAEESTCVGKGAAPRVNVGGSEIIPFSAYSTDTSSTYGSWYWNGLSQLCATVRCVGFVSMPTFHVRQVELWVCEANESLPTHLTSDGMNQLIPFVQVTPPALSVTELENQRLLREGLVPGNSGLTDVFTWLPEQLKEALHEELPQLPLTFRVEEHDRFFDEFSRLRFPNQREGKDVGIRVDSTSGSVRIVAPDMLSERDKPLWLHPPSLLTKYDDKRLSLCPHGKKRSAKEIQHAFRHSCTLAAIEEIVDRREKRAAQLSGEGNPEAAHKAVQVSTAVMMCIQAPGLREDALTCTWECMTKRKI